MQRDTHTIRWLTRGLGTILALVISSTVVHGGYTSPNQSGSLLGEVSAFVGDFGSWSEARGNLPMEFLAMTPTAQQGDALVLLFWLWLHEGEPGQAGKASSSSPPGSTTLAGLSLPSGSGDPPGSIVLGQLGNDPPSLSSNGGSDPPGLGGNGGSGSLSSDLPSPSGGSGPPFGLPPLGGNDGDSDEGPFTPADPTPAPASLTLLAVGSAGLLIGLWMRRRRLV